VAMGLVTFDQIEKAELIGSKLGLIKYVVERGSRRLLGCHVIGRQAADLVWSASLVIHRRGTLDELATAVGIFPTLAEGMEGTARGLLRRLAPEIAGGPLAAMGSAPRPPQEVTMATRNNISCPACGVDFEVGERLEEIAGAAQPLRLDEPSSMPPAGEPVSFACPACGADFETQERLVETER
jgi:hypothetical protein